MDEPKPEPAHSKPYKVYEANFLRLMELAHASQSPIPDIVSRLNREIELTKPFVQTLTKTTGTPGQYDFDSPAFQQNSARLSDAIAEVSRMVTEMTNSLNSSHFLSNWMLVMLVTFTEAYLQDILSLIISSGIQVRSLPPAIADEIKNKWTRNIREGGPRIWVRQLNRLGATGYRRDLVPRMKKIWVRRHEIVHSAAEIDNTAMQEFISATKVVNEFVETTDQFVVTSCP